MPSDSPLKRTAAAGQTTLWEQRKKPKKRADSALVENLCIADLRPFMHLTLEQAAEELKVGTTVLKRIARKCGIPKWPSRQIGWLNLKIEAVSSDIAMASPSMRSTLQQQLGKLLQARDEVYATGKVPAGFIKQWNAKQGIDGHASEDDNTSDADDALSSSPQTSAASTPSIGSSCCTPCAPGVSYLPGQQQHQHQQYQQQPQQHQSFAYGSNMADKLSQCIDIAEPAMPLFYHAYPAAPQAPQADWAQSQLSPADLPDVYFDMDDLEELDRILMTFVEDEEVFDFDL